MRKLKRMMQEAHAACDESVATGAPIDEVIEIRAERRERNVAAAREVVEGYNEVARKAREGGSPEDHAAASAAMENVRRIGRGQPLLGSRALDRREFLTGAGKAAVGLAAGALAGSGVLRPSRASAAGPRIAIIGGGLAGLHCAHQLWINRGLTSTLYEASADVGGRCETLRGYFLNNQIAEMHGEFISSEHADVLNLGKRYAFGIDDLWATPLKTVDTYWINGSRYTQSDVTTDWKAFGYDTFHNAVLQVQAPQTYASHNAQAVTWDNQDTATWVAANLPGGSTTKLYKLALEAAIGNFGGDSTDISALSMIWMWGYNTSAKNTHSYQTNSYLWVSGTDERWHFTGGNDQMVTRMVGELPAGTIQFNQALVALANNGNGTYTLTLQSGRKTSQVIVDHVVLALPFKTLRNVDLTKAGLSALKTTAINTLGMGTSAKVMFQFNGHPWYTNGYDGNLLADSPTNWMWEMNYQVNNNNAPTGILIQYPGAGVTQADATKYNLSMHDGVPPSTMVNDILAPVDTYYGPGVKAAYNGKAWYHFGLLDQWVGGGYSYWRVGQITGFSGIEGAREGNIHFAGEHTSLEFQGYMNGALQTGAQCSTEI